MSNHLENGEKRERKKENWRGGGGTELCRDGSSRIGKMRRSLFDLFPTLKKMDLNENNIFN
jgi:hypothetical protein